MKTRKSNELAVLRLAAKLAREKARVRKLKDKYFREVGRDKGRAA